MTKLSTDVLATASVDWCNHTILGSRLAGSSSRRTATDVIGMCDTHCGFVAANAWVYAPAFATKQHSQQERTT